MSRRLLALLVLVTAALAWVGADAARVVHESTVLHVVCVHGEISEVAPDDDDDDAPQKDFHTHGCAFDALANAGRDTPPTFLPEPEVTVAPAPEVLVRLLQAARPPPLSFAPKTSPPSAG